eukprot:gene23505-biopygen23837
MSSGSGCRADESFTVYMTSSGAIYPSLGAVGAEMQISDPCGPWRPQPGAVRIPCGQALWGGGRFFMARPPRPPWEQGKCFVNSQLAPGVFRWRRMCVPHMDGICGPQMGGICGPHVGGICGPQMKLHLWAAIPWHLWTANAWHVRAANAWHLRAVNAWYLRPTKSHHLCPTICGQQLHRICGPQSHPFVARKCYVFAARKWRPIKSRSMVQDVSPSPCRAAEGGRATPPPPVDPRDTRDMWGPSGRPAGGGIPPSFNSRP